MLLQDRKINPNPHGLKAITKLTASGLKEPILPPPLAQHCVVKGGGGHLLCSPEDLLNKNASYT
jgi:hypothetical protein